MFIWNYLFKHTSLARKFDYRIISSFLELNKEDKILDIGCGNGTYLSKSLRKEFFPNLLGVDLRIENLRKAKENRELADAEFVLANAELLPIKKNSFNKVYSNSAIEHFLDADAFLAGVNKILPKNGLLVLVTDVTPAEPTILTKLIYLFTPDFLKDKEFLEIAAKSGSLKNAFVEKQRKANSITAYYDTKKITARLKKNGFEVIDSRYYFNGFFSKSFKELTYCTKFRIIGRGFVGRLFFPLWYSIALAEFYLISAQKKGCFLAVKAKRGRER